MNNSSWRTLINKQLTLGVIAALLIGTGLSAPPAQAQPSSFVVTLTEEGPNVVATGSGTINTTDLRFGGETMVTAVIAPDVAAIFTGPTGFTPTTVYSGFAGPTNFGSGSGIDVSSGSGMRVGISVSHDTIFVPRGYVSGSPLMSTSTWDDATFSSLGVTPGTYVWTWGSGANAGSFTLRAAVPEPAKLGLITFGLLGAVERPLPRGRFHVRALLAANAGVSQADRVSRHD
jgi:hypothetical protein